MMIDDVFEFIKHCKAIMFYVTFPRFPRKIEDLIIISNNCAVGNKTSQKYL